MAKNCLRLSENLEFGAEQKEPYKEIKLYTQINGKKTEYGIFFSAEIADKFMDEMEKIIKEF